MNGPRAVGASNESTSYNGEAEGLLPNFNDDWIAHAQNDPVDLQAYAVEMEAPDVAVKASSEGHSKQGSDYEAASQDLFLQSFGGRHPVNIFVDSYDEANSR